MRKKNSKAQWEKEEGNSCTESQRSPWDSLGFVLYDCCVLCQHPSCFSFATIIPVGLGGLMLLFRSSVVIALPYFGHSSVKQIFIEYLSFARYFSRWWVCNNEQIVKNPSI